MATVQKIRSNSAPIGIGCYTAVEAARLLRVPTRNIARWLGGYQYKTDGESVAMAPLWTPQLPNNDNRLELGFRDLIELRFVDAFLKAGLRLPTIRACLAIARDIAGDDRPFSTRRFQTDGRKIFLQSLDHSGADDVLDLTKKQYVFGKIIEQSFKDLDIESDAVARWRPYKGRETILIDPTRAFGQPIAAESGVPTETLADAVIAEGSIERVANIFEVATTAVRDSVAFEKELRAA